MKIIAIDIGGTKIASALVTLAEGVPSIEYQENIPTEAKAGGAHVLERVIAAAKRVQALAPDAEGIGVSTAGVVDPRNGDIVYANEIMPGWCGTHLGAELADACGLRVGVLNDVHAHALGEARHGAGRNAASCLCVAVGTGMSGAFVDHGFILLGAHGVAGHIGHVGCTLAAGLPCTCGATGHVETVAAGPAIAAEYIRLGGDSEDGAEINRRALAGDEAAIAAQARAGLALGEVLGSMANTFDPEAIILSSSVANCGHHWSDALRTAYAALAMKPVAETPILSGELGGDAPLIGAAEHFKAPAYRELLA